MVLSVLLPTKAEPAIVPFKLIVIGASAGGLKPLLDILQRLPADFAVPIVVVQHLGAESHSRLPEVLNFRSSLPCRWARDGEAPQRGRVLVAAPGANTVLTPEGRLARVRAHKPRLGWPSVDSLLLSMAANLGPQGVAVVLSGMMWDGAAGIGAVRRSGGATLVQHPRTAEFPDMPASAVDLGRADLMMSPEQIADALIILGELGVE